jgi:hypothetical protein
MPDIFEPAIHFMNETNANIYSPTSFMNYLNDHNFSSNIKPAPIISIDSIRKLRPELRENEIMVFRLGSPTGQRHTYFSLARVVSGWDDYFFIDSDLFGDKPPDGFVPSVPMTDLFPFIILPKFSETSLVNLAASSGLLSHALQLDESTLPSAPATGQGTFSFSFRPHSQINVNWTHNAGQVEIDGLFTGKRNGKISLFVVEAKRSANFDTLAKHKLLYPILALSEKVPSYMPLIPVYIRAIKRGDEIHFYIAECETVDLNDPILSNIKANKLSHYVIVGIV